MAILYRHIRLDTNQVFYIGIGRNKRRAYCKSGRSEEWKKVYNLTPIEVEIILEHSDWDFICQKEKEFIALYGRSDLNEGCLVNKTSGGSTGTPNRVVTNKQRRVLQILGKRRFQNIEERLKISNSLKGRFVGEQNPFYGKTHTEENKRKFSRKGSKHSDETKKLMSEIRSGDQNSFYGKTHSSHTKNKMSISHKNMTKETRNKMSESQSKMRWVKKGMTCKRIHMNELNEYLSNGWVRGQIRSNTKYNGEI